MTRRSMLALGTRALAAYPVLARTGPLNAFAGAQAGQSIPAGVLRRIGITTVCFRDRFTQTREKTAGPIPAGQELTLLTAPRFVADTLGLHNVGREPVDVVGAGLTRGKQPSAGANAACQPRPGVRDRH